MTVTTLWLTRMHNLPLARRTRWNITAATDALQAAQLFCASVLTTETGKQCGSARGVDVVPQRVFPYGRVDVKVDKLAKADGSDNKLRDRYLHDGIGDVVASEFSKLWDWTKLQHVLL